MSGHPVISEEDLHAYVDGRLDPERRAVVGAYLRETPDAAARVAEDIAQRQALRAALGPLAAEPLPPSLNLARLVEERLTRRRFPWLATAAAIVALLIGGGGGWLLKSQPPAGLQALVQEAGASYAVFVPDVNRPVELWADQKALLTRWISRRLDRPINPPDLSAQGYHLLGGRLLASPHGAAALFVYENDHKTRLTLYVRPMKAGQTAPMRLVDATSGDGCAWIEHGIGYMVMAAEPYDELQRLADEVRKQASAT